MSDLARHRIALPRAVPQDPAAIRPLKSNDTSLFDCVRDHAWPALSRSPNAHFHRTARHRSRLASPDSIDTHPRKSPREPVFWHLLSDVGDRFQIDQRRLSVVLDCRQRLVGGAVHFSGDHAIDGRPQAGHVLPVVRFHRTLPAQYCRCVPRRRTSPSRGIPLAHSVPRSIDPA